VNRETDIAVVGVGCRFPDAWTPQEFWDNLDKGVVSTRELTREELESARVPEEMLQSDDYVPVGARLPGVEQFAADFFGFSAREAELTDPQHRLFLEVCWEALESAGHPPGEGGHLVGVYAGMSFSSYSMALYAERVRQSGVWAIGDGELRYGSLPDFMPSRVAYRLGLRGPAVAVQTACSSSLAAVHHAVNSLLAGECDIALAGGTGMNLPEAGYLREPGSIHSEDGHCRSFDIRSTGTANGAGVGVVVLRRLADALADGDHVWAVVRGSAINNDGADRPGFTAPSPRGVAEAVATALDVAEVGADRLCYVEAHGSGTPLGDHVELAGLSEALRHTTSRTGFCGLGSVKSNIGHSGSAAGVAGLIKAVHVAHTGNLPPHPLFESARDSGELAESPFTIGTSLEHTADPDRHVLVNSMGLGGTNVAVVLGAPPRTAPADTQDPGPVRLVLSARNRRELDEMSRRLADVIETGTVPLADVAHTLRVGRKQFACRRTVTGTATELAAALRLPRPPAARTAQAEQRRAVVVCTAAGEEAFAATAYALKALGATARLADTLTDPAPKTVVLVIGPAESAPGRHIVGLGGPPARAEAAEPWRNAVDQALYDLWMDGVDLDWAAVSSGAGRRVPLPVYPLPRRRYWALDQVSYAFPGADRTAAAQSRPAAAGEPQAPPGGGVEGEVAQIWAELFGLPTVGLDDEFGALGGTSLLATRMALEIGRRHGIQLNLHRVGGTRATVRRIAAVVRARTAQDAPVPGARTSDGQAPSGIRAPGEQTPAGQAAGAGVDPDLAAVDADLELPIAPKGVRTGDGTGVLLTGATGYLGAFLLRDLVARTDRKVYALVRADSVEEGRRRLRDTARGFLLPEPDPDRVDVVLGGLEEVGAALDRHRGGVLTRAVGHVLHCAASVVFTEPYRTLRGPNVQATADLLSWAGTHGIPDFSYVSSLAACGGAGPSADQVLESREQPLALDNGGYGTTKWVSERLVDRAERDGLRVRVFRPGLVLGDSETGACNPKDMTWRLIAGCLATGLHPLDDRAMELAPVDVVSRAIVALMSAPGASGRAHHLVGAEPVSVRRLFGSLADAGLPTRGVPADTWHRAVADQALATGDGVLSSVALYRLDDGAPPLNVHAQRWQGWLRDNGLSADVPGAALLKSLRYLAARPGSGFGELLAPHTTAMPLEER
jgi:phthiocerol/phenolphthiocerol synthesis type-I polyketide synthase E